MSATLVLNASYEPLGTVSQHRAVVLVLAGKAAILDAGAEVLHSELLDVATPLVVRLLTWVRVPYSRQVPLTRVNVLRRDSYRCAYCGGPAATIDHVIPRSRGGAHSWGNVVAACGSGRSSRNCNGRKGNRMLAELGWTLHHTPAEPPGGEAWLAGTLSGADPVWDRWLTPVAA